MGLVDMIRQVSEMPLGKSLSIKRLRRVSIDY